MQYRLRTLLIAVTVSCVVLALAARDGGYWISIRVGAILLLAAPFAAIAEVLIESWIKERIDRFHR